ncbi:MAG: HD domain-containing protein [Proteobacteria bacterium]|nr:MAG: HD domain-containing protein [Pseudomonadota bacterium]
MKGMAKCRNLRISLRLGGDPNEHGQRQGEAMEKLAETLPDDAHYVRQVTALGDRRTVMASEHIENADGMRLVRAGASINRELYDKLVRHKLLKPLDSSLNVDNPVTVTTLLHEAKSLLDREPCLAQIIEMTPHQEPMRVLGAVALNEALSFKLTVCHERAPEKFKHLLRVALASVFLGDHLGLGDGELVELASAGLFHDLGELHIDPQLFAAPRPLSQAERRQIYTHPYVAYLILKSFSQYHPRISSAVLDHHERLDGSGYPRGLRGAAVNSMGLMLAVTELVVVMLERTRSRPDPQRMAAMLKLNMERFGQERVTPFIEVILRQGCGQSDGESADHAITADALRSHLATLGGVLQLPANWPSTPTANFVAEQLDALRQLASRIGLSSESTVDTVALLGDDAAGLAEMEHLVGELSYQVSAVVHEVERRWPQMEVDDAIRGWLQAASALDRAPAAIPTADTMTADSD